MKIIIVEDEIIARQKLEGLLNGIASDIEILAHLESVEETVKWIRDNASPDIAFFDIQLSDASCFEIFERIQVNFPVIFLTAYDDYVMKAFDHNAIHYILKPATKTKVAEALKKVSRFRDHFVHLGIQNLPGEKDKKNYTERLVVRKGLDAVPLPIDAIAYFFSEHKISFAKTSEGISYMVDEPLIELERKLNPSSFFRVNRQYLVNINAIKNFRSNEQSKIVLELEPPVNDEVIISKENAGNFRKWIRGE